ncbi:MAG: tetratricopeptide repeat protein, partial [Thermoplasmata archaeon]|nr:tetratricopeptide repeat protein [Thermoplasmata archaeon]
SYNQKDYSLSLECYDRLVEVSRDSGDLFMESLGLIGLGAAHEVLGNYEAAKENLDRSLKNARKMNYKQGLPYALIYLGRIYSSQGAYGEAMDRFREALEISESIQTKRTLNFAWSSLGNLHKTLKEHAKAEGCYDEAIAIGRELDHKHVLCGNLYQLADLYFLMGRGDESGALNEEALSMAESIDQQSVVFQCRVLGSKLLASSDKSGAVSRLEGMLADIDEDKERASVLYELHGLTGDRRTEALDLYVRLYEAVPNVLYKDRIEELGGSPGLS